MKPLDVPADPEVADDDDELERRSHGRLAAEAAAAAPPPPKAAAGLDEARDLALFSLCHRRDTYWLDLIANSAYEERWHAERSEHRRGNASLQFEFLAIHRAGAQIIAVVVD